MRDTSHCFVKAVKKSEAPKKKVKLGTYMPDMLGIARDAAKMPAKHR
jgi:hypothetical protein